MLESVVLVIRLQIWLDVGFSSLRSSWEGKQLANSLPILLLALPQLAELSPLPKHLQDPVPQQNIMMELVLLAPQEILNALLAHLQKLALLQ